MEHFSLIRFGFSPKKEKLQKEVEPTNILAGLKVGQEHELISIINQSNAFSDSQSVRVSVICLCDTTSSTRRADQDAQFNEELLLAIDFFTE